MTFDTRLTSCQKCVKRRAYFWESLILFLPPSSSRSRSTCLRFLSPKKYSHINERVISHSKQKVRRLWSVGHSKGDKSTWMSDPNEPRPPTCWLRTENWLTYRASITEVPLPPETGFATATHANFSVHGATSLILGIRDGWLRYSVSHRRSQCVVLTTQQKGSVPDYNLNEAKSVAGNHWLRLSPSVALLRGQVWSS